MGTKGIHKGVLLLALMAVLAALGLSGCSTAATSTAGCGFIVGDGQNGHDANIHSVVLPGENKGYGDGEDVQYVPCNSRNYIVAPNSADKGGTDPIVVRTADNTPVKVIMTALWTLNQDRDVLKKFHDFAMKYKDLFSSDPFAGSLNSSTAGWNDMLAENFWPTLRLAAEQAMHGIHDDIWKNDDAVLKKTVADAISNSFADDMRIRTGFAENLFCGSGNSQMQGDKFFCSNVRVEVQLVTAADDATQNAAVDAQRDQLKNQLKTGQADARITLAQKLYGTYWDMALFCEDHPAAQCVVTNGANGVQVQSAVPPK